MDSVQAKNQAGNIRVYLMTTKMALAARNSAWDLKLYILLENLAKHFWSYRELSKFEIHLSLKVAATLLSGLRNDPLRA